MPVLTAYTIPLQLPTVRWSGTGLRAQDRWPRRPGGQRQVGHQHRPWRDSGRLLWPEFRIWMGRTRKTDEDATFVPGANCNSVTYADLSSVRGSAPPRRCLRSRRRLLAQAGHTYRAHDFAIYV